LKKYEDRGFKVVEPLQYSIYENEIHSMEGDQYLPIATVVDMLSRSKRRKI
jgi:hypothetical protein